MNSTTLKVPNQQHNTLESKMGDCSNHSGSRCSLADSGSISSCNINDNSQSLSRDSSFSSYSTSSTTGSSSCGCDLDSPLRRIVARGSSRKYFEQRRGDQEDRPSSRLINSRRNIFDFNREGGVDGQCTPKLYKASSLDATGFPQQEPDSERSRSEPEVSLKKCLLSSPQGLIIATPPTKRVSVTERRVRSKSDSYDDDDNNETPKPKNGSKESKKKDKAKRRETTSFDWYLDESVMKRVLAFLDGEKNEEAIKEDSDLKRQIENLKKERDAALSERDEAFRDCDRLKCERNAVELERDNLLQERDDLKKELANRSRVIDHLKDHLGMAHIPVKMDSTGSPFSDSPKTSKETLTLTLPKQKNFRPRSKSEVRPPEFFVPDEFFQKSNAYTRI